MPSETKAKIVLSHFNWSLARLKEAIAKEDTEYYRGAALQRFGLTYDMALKTIRAFAKEQDHTCTDDESCFLWVEEKHKKKLQNSDQLRPGGVPRVAHRINITTLYR